ncbi:phosphatase PAP2 family protein [Spirosoma sp. KUDC1026]|uniref:phosphatase PAP2 family protein n=1 Tax=Spirosoma sp. KUDC1026 TaxID=2745947 RepID=UPI00293C01DD|nr:phosphatase PAP2 family protein [Spirosoma sp. KUDC1026]
MALAWSDMQLKLIRNTSGFAPPIAARSFGYAGITLYEAIVAGLPERRSLVGQLQQLTKLPKPETNQAYNWVLSANAAQAFILKSLFANTSTVYKNRIDSLENALYTQYKSPDNAVNQRSAEFGKAIAAAIFEWSKTDGGHEAYSRVFPTGYTVPTGAGMWQPTENNQKTPMLPYWGKNRTFLSATSTLPMPTPLVISTDVKSQYFAQYLEVYTKNKALTQPEKEIAVWWADDPSETFTPPGHSYNLARIAIKTSGAPLGKAAETLARTGIAVTDAFIACWKCKYTFNNERPYTYVRRAIDPNWIPFWPSPPFPGYSSGHATQSAASATVLADLFGDQFPFTDDTHTGRARDVARNTDFKARRFKSFWETAEESALSRFLGGIHTRQDNDTGLQEGRKIGQYINALQWKK